MNKLTGEIIIGAFAMSVVMSTNVIAGERDHTGTDYAKVLSADPITRQVEHKTPRESCWTERVRVDRSRPKNDSYAGTLVGGVIGGAIGNAVGHKKRNKQVGTAVGALLGAAIGHDISNKNRSYSNDSYYTNERRCETTYDVEYHNETVGYWVTYRYHGQKFRTRMNEHPGSRIRVRVTVEPI